MDELPTIGLGTAHVKAEEMFQVLQAALVEAKLTHVDCAKVYGNEESVGKVLKELKIKRDEIFITSKLWNDDHRNVEQACRASLNRLVRSF